MTTHQQAAALCSLGVIRTNEDHSAEAVELLREAVALCCADARYHANLAVALDRLGTAEGRLETREEAIAECFEALRLQPDFVDVICNLGTMLCGVERPAEALPHLERASALAPSSINAIQGCADALVQLKRWEEAGRYLAKWTRLCPRDATAWLKTGEYHAKQEMWVEAVACFERALKLCPGSFDALNNLVSCLSSGGRNLEALYVLYRELKRHPKSAVTWSNIGCIWRKLGRQQAALECFDKAVEIDPGFPNPVWGRSLCLTAVGRVSEGWAGYDLGLKTGDRMPKRAFGKPHWAGGKLQGKTVLVWMEQGLGDQIAFANVLPDLLRTGARCIVECEHRLVTLFQRSFPGVQFVAQTNPPHSLTQEPGIDFEVPAGSLMQWYRPSVETFPKHGGYLTPDPDRVAMWRERLEALGPGLKVGICWRSLLTKEAQLADSTRLSQWGPILSIPGVHWISLQPGDCEKDFQEVGDLFDCRFRLWEDFDAKRDQEGTAALLSVLDLTLSAFTATAQMAGAVGAPVWVASHAGNQAWWTLGTDHCPWHPSIKFFPYGLVGGWESVILEMATQLQEQYR